MSNGGNQVHEFYASIINDRDDRLPNGRSRCFDIGSTGGCGVTCAAFVDGECSEPQEITSEDVTDEYGEDAFDIFARYRCFDEITEMRDQE